MYAIRSYYVEEDIKSEQDKLKDFKDLISESNSKIKLHKEEIEKLQNKGNHEKEILKLQFENNVMTSYSIHYTKLYEKQQNTG